MSSRARVSGQSMHDNIDVSDNFLSCELKCMLQMRMGVLYTYSLVNVHLMGMRLLDQQM